MWAGLTPLGRDARTGGYRRYAWSREDSSLREWFTGECANRGLDVVTDRAGNLWAWWGDPDAVRADGRRGGVAIGSHLDSVPDGGAYDGPLGVVSSFAAVDALRASGLTPTVPLGIACFGDEEGARFGIACAGSRILTGALTTDEAMGLRDPDGRTMAEALHASGHSPLEADPEALQRISAFVELHVEQGRALADTERYDQSTSAVAVGSDIWPHGRWRLDVPGRADHAGTTRLADRDDAMLTYAGLVLTARRLAEAGGCVATTGRVQVEPNATNAVPSHVTGWLDARGADEDAVRDLVAALAAEAQAVRTTVTRESWTATTRFDEALVARLAAAVGPAAPVLGTGAGHDAGILAQHGIPSAMLFVRNPTGISHSPDEHADPADCHEGVTALARVVADLTEATAATRAPAPGAPA
ncbi:MAG: allantoate amidohydrolase [Actinomycetota bacterium]|nr:allantoate amidohydrolase [Actinomycetota bacterium]